MRIIQINDFIPTVPSYCIYNCLVIFGSHTYGEIKEPRWRRQNLQIESAKAINFSSSSCSVRSLMSGHLGHLNDKKYKKEQMIFRAYLLGKPRCDEWHLKCITIRVKCIKRVGGNGSYHTKYTSWKLITNCGVVYAVGIVKKGERQKKWDSINYDGRTFLFTLIFN